MFKKWLTNKISVEDAETKHLVTDERLGPESVPFGYMLETWKAFKAKIQNGDELWEFSSPVETWQNLSGRAGLCIVRKGKIITSILTVMN